MIEIKDHVEVRWAFIYKFQYGYRFLGKYCWNFSTYNDQQIITFRTRDIARKAKKELRCYKKSKIVKIDVIIRVKELKK